MHALLWDVLTMCGIAGHLGTHRPTEATLREALASIAHRGPDAEGTWFGDTIALGHRRLAVLDLTDAGRQPMRRANLTLTFNGEIYNYIELRDELRDLGYRFHSRTDTEVLLTAYAHWGEACLTRLNGMFAFAIWDEERRTLFCARDRLGIKPFLYAATDTDFIFASEAKTVLRLLGAPVPPDTAEIAAWLTNGYSRSDRTWFQGILKLPPAHCLTVRLTGGRVRQHLARWWSLPEAAESRVDPAEVRRLLDASVRLRLRSDVPVGFHLSGGIDSSSIVALAAHAGHSPVTFSGYFENAPRYDERPHITEMQRAFGLRHHQTAITPEGFKHGITEMLRLMDYPEAGPGAYNQFVLNRLMREKGIVVSIGGQGGDELFGGYWHHVTAHLRHLLRVRSLGPLARDLALLLASPVFLGEALRALRRRTLPGAPSLLAEDLRIPRPDAPPRRATIGERLRDDVQHYLPALLHVEDRTSMAWSIESRVPFLDHTLVEYVFSCAATSHIHGARLKASLRRAMKALVPLAILHRKDKRGFNAPLGEWFAGPLKGWTSQTLLGEGALAPQTILSRSALEEMLRHHALPDRDLSDALWKALAIETWLNIYRPRLLL